MNGCGGRRGLTEGNGDLAQRLNYVPGGVDAFDAGLLVRPHANVAILIAQDFQFNRQFRPNVTAERRIDDVEFVSCPVAEHYFIACAARDDVVDGVQEGNAYPRGF